MLVLRHNRLDSDSLFVVERKMLKVLEGQVVNKPFELNVFNYTRPELYGILLGIFTKLSLHHAIGVQVSELLDFIIDIDQGYFKNPYHSFLHAVDVTCVLYFMLTTLGAQQCLTRTNVASLLIAALCHDIGHPGCNNLYEVNAKTELALRYSNKSVLESHSGTLTMNLLDKHRLLRSIEQVDRMTTEQNVRTSIIKMILATDMVFHFDLQERLSKLVDLIEYPFADEPPPDDEASANQQDHHQQEVIIRGDLSQPQQDELGSEPHYVSNEWPASPEFDLSAIPFSDAQRQDILNILLHASDISNTVRPWDLCKKWSDLVVEEFWRQGDLEKAEGLPISPSMNRDENDQKEISLNFADFVVRPYFEVLADFLPNSRVFLDYLQENRKIWDTVEAEELEALHQLSLQDPNMHGSIDMLSTPHSRSVSPAHTPRRFSVAAGLIELPDAIFNWDGGGAPGLAPQKKNSEHSRHLHSPTRGMGRTFSGTRAMTQRVPSATSLRSLATQPTEGQDNDRLGARRLSNASARGDLENAATRRRSDESKSKLGFEMHPNYD